MLNIIDIITLTSLTGKYKILRKMFLLYEMYCFIGWTWAGALPVDKTNFYTSQ